MKLLILKRKNVLWPLLASLVINLASWAWIYFAFPHSAGLSILRYNIYFGISRIGPWWHFFLMPLVGLVIFLFNAFIINLYINRQRFVVHFLTFSTLVFEALILLVSIFYWRLNV